MANPDNVNLMNEFANGAGAIAEAQFEDECRVAAVTNAIPVGSRAKILGELAKTDDWKSYKYLPLVFNQVWCLLASVSNDHKVVLVDTATWKTSAIWDAHEGDAVGVAFHPSRALLATTGQDGEVRVWTLDGKRLAEAKLPRAGNAVAFSSDGQRLAVATDDKVVVFEVFEIK